MTTIELCDRRGDEIIALQKELDLWKRAAIALKIDLQGLYYTAERALGDMPAGRRKEYLTEDVKAAEAGLKAFREHMILLETKSFKEALQPRGRDIWTFSGGASCR